MNGWLRIFWDCNVWSLDSTNILGYSTPHTGPILIPMWFIRDLIVTVLITPIIYKILKEFKIWAISILAICYITEIWPYIHGFSITAIFFFCFGAYFSIHNLNIVNELKRTRKWIFYLYFLTTILMIFLHGNLTTVGQRIYPIYIIIGVMTIINLATILEENVKLPINNTLSKTTFFIYAFHGLIALEIASIILKMPFPTEDNNWQNVIIHYCLKPFLTLGICLTSYYIMQKYTPHLLNILTGNRNIKKE